MSFVAEPNAGPKTPPPEENVRAEGEIPEGALGDFDFLEGRWRVRHRCLIRSVWQEFDGVCEMRKVLGARANVDENSWTTSSGIHRALTVRVFDPERRAWSIFWLDTRWPTAFGPPVIGGFHDTHGVFFGDDQLNGRPIRVRFDWSVDTADTCRWKQAFSFDAGASWETNWCMLFARDARPETLPGKETR